MKTYYSHRCKQNITSIDLNDINVKKKEWCSFKLPKQTWYSMMYLMLVTYMLSKLTLYGYWPTFEKKKKQITNLLKIGSICESLYTIEGHLLL